MMTYYTFCCKILLKPDNLNHALIVSSLCILYNESSAEAARRAVVLLQIFELSAQIKRLILEKNRLVFEETKWKLALEQMNSVLEHIKTGFETNVTFLNKWFGKK